MNLQNRKACNWRGPFCWLLRLPNFRDFIDVWDAGLLYGHRNLYFLESDPQRLSLHRQLDANRVRNTDMGEHARSFLRSTIVTRSLHGNGDTGP